MGRFVKGEVVAVNFPFSDFSEQKRRPALVLASLLGDDVILCQITTVSRSDGYSIHLSELDFAQGRLRQESFIRPNHIFTADSKILERSVGRVNLAKMQEVLDAVVRIIQS